VRSAKGVCGLDINDHLDQRRYRVCDCCCHCCIFVEEEIDRGQRSVTEQMSVFVSIVNALPALYAYDDRVVRVVDVCEYVIGKCILRLSTYISTKARSMDLAWDSILAFYVGSSVEKRVRVDSHTPVRSLPFEMVLFIEFETLPRNVTPEETAVIIFQSTVALDMDDMTDAQLRVVCAFVHDGACSPSDHRAKIIEHNKRPHVVRIMNRCGFFDVVVHRSMQMDEFLFILQREIRCFSCILQSRSGRRVDSMSDVRMYAVLYAVSHPPRAIAVRDVK
jgi:hypothetical protein